MDHVTSAIVGALTALAAGAGQGLSQMGRDAILSGYSALKAKIIGKNKSAALSDALIGVETSPTSKTHVQQLEQAIVAADLHHDAGVVDAANQLAVTVATHASSIHIINNGTVEKQINADTINGPITM